MSKQKGWVRDATYPNCQVFAKFSLRRFLHQVHSQCCHMHGIKQEMFWSPNNWIRQKIKGRNSSISQWGPDRRLVSAPSEMWRKGWGERGNQDRGQKTLLRPSKAKGEHDKQQKDLMKQESRWQKGMKFSMDTWKVIHLRKSNYNRIHKIKASKSTISIHKSRRGAAEGTSPTASAQHLMVASTASEMQLIISKRTENVPTHTAESIALCIVLVVPPQKQLQK